MPFNVSGVFERLYSWVTDRDNSINIDATRMDADTDGIVDGINAIVNQTQPFTGSVKAPAGTALTPAYSFGNDPDTGMYRTGSNSIGFAAGGENIFTLTGDLATLADPLRIPEGTQSAPAVQFSNANNGIYWIVGGGADAGPVFTVGGVNIARMTPGTSLDYAITVVTRQAGDARYVIRGTAGQVDTYAFLRLTAGGSLSFGQTVSGSQLSPANASGTASGTVFGTWECMGYINAGTDEARTSLFRRVL